VTSTIIVAQMVNPSVVSDDPVKWTWYVLVAVLSGAVGWIIEALRKATEIQQMKSNHEKLIAEKKKLESENTKLQTEQVKLAGDILEKVHKSRDGYADAAVKCTTRAKILLKLLKENGDGQNVRDARDDLCAAITRDAIHGLAALAEIQCLSRKNDGSRLIPYIFDVADELQKIAEWVEIVNMPMFVEGFESEPLKIFDNTVRPFKEMLLDIPIDSKHKVVDELTGSILRLTSA